MTTTPPTGTPQPRCNWSMCGATEDLTPFACGARCPSHTPAALAGQLEPDELHALAGARKTLESLEPTRTAALETIARIEQRQRELAQHAAARRPDPAAAA